MTTATQGFTGQPMTAGFAGQQGTFGPGFPLPIGAEHIYGMGSPITQGQPFAGWQQGITPAFQGQPWIPQQYQLVAQLAPVVQQAVLPYAISAACQQVLQVLPQVVAQLAVHPGALTQQYLPQVQGFGPIGRPYSHLS